MNTHDDDFWGTDPEWTPSPEAPAYGTKRTGPFEVIRKAWMRMLDSGADPQRAHGSASTTPTAAAPASKTAFDDLVDDWTDVDETRTPTATTEPTASIEPAAAPTKREQPVVAPEADIDVAATTSIARTEAGADDVTDYSYADDPGIVVNPVAAREAASTPTSDAWDDDEAWLPAAVVESTRSLDPLLLKVGGIVVVLAMLVPLLLSLRSDEGDRLASITPATSQPVVTLLDPSTTLAATSEAATPATSVAEVTTTAAPTTAAPTTAAPTTRAPDTTVERRAQQQEAATTTEAAAVAADEVTAAPTSTEAATTTAAPTTAAPATTAAAVTTTATATDTAERIERTCAIEYEVVAGDWWIRLSKGAGVELAELLEANGATTDTPLYPGQTICLPAGSTTPPPPPATPAAPDTTTAPATTTPDTTTTTTTTAPNPPPSGGNVEQIIRNVWPDELEDRALEIAYRESRYVPTAKNFCCYGIFQIYWEVHKSWLTAAGVTSADMLYDPVVNAQAAYALYQRAGGWGPWKL